MKKVLTYLLSMVMVTALAVGATFAYLQDIDSDVNVMTIGNVDIEQLEFERSTDSNGNYEVIKVDSGNNYLIDTYELKEFTQDKPLCPAYYDSNEFNFDVYDATLQLWSTIGSQGSSKLYYRKVKNALDKFVFVKNTGISNAYVRTIFAFEQATFSKEELFNEIINLNINTKQCKWENVGTTSIDGTNYYILIATYNYELTPGSTTHPSLLQVVMHNTLDNEDVSKFGDEYKIYTVSQAVQTKGFTNASTALNTAFGEITTDNHPWNYLTNDNK